MEAVEPSRESDCRLFGSSSSEGTSTDAARTDNVAGYFDPISILINFRLSDLPSQTEHLDEGLNLRGLLNLVPSSLVAHEFCHFVQTLGTSAGLWIFDANVGLANVQTMLAITQVQAHGDAVRPPLWPRALVASDEDSQHLVYEIRQAEAWIAVATGGRTASQQVIDTVRSWNYGAFGFATREIINDTTVSRRQPLVRLATSLGPTVIHLGYRHLAEGTARAIEFAHERMEPYLDRFVAASELPVSLNPYWICYVLYLKILVGSKKRRFRHGVCIEFVALADLAMMLDTFALGPVVGESSEWLVPFFERTMTNTVGVFVELTEVLCWSTIERLDPWASDDDVLAFQTAVLQAACGRDATMAELTDLMAQVAASIAEHHRAGVALSQTVLIGLFEEAVGRLAQFRKEYSRGSAIMTDLLVSDKAVRDMFHHLVPSYAVGHAAVGRDNVFGDLSELRFIEDAAWSLLCGDRVCPWHTGHRRMCREPVQPLCFGISGREGASPCARFRVMDSLIRPPSSDNLSG